MRLPRRETSDHTWVGRGSYRTAAWLLGSVFLLVFVGSCDVGPNSPSMNSTTTTTTTTTTAAPTTTTTTTGGTTTTTTTTTTTGGLIDYASQVHPIWDAEQCTNCHDSSGNPLDLSGSPTTSCANIASRDSSNANLIITGGGAAGSEILEKAEGRVSHAGGSFSCFGGSGQACYDTVLAWLQEGANGPSGTCGG